jgi:hypothetical protein
LKPALVMATFAHGYCTQTQASARRISVSGIRTPRRHSWHIRRSAGSGHTARPPLKKTVCKECGQEHTSWYDRTVRRARDLSSADTRIYLEFEVRRIRCPCNGKVRREHLDFLADNPLYTKRFAWFVGRRCRSGTIKDVAKELNLHWGAVKELDKEYMRIQLERAGTPGPKAIGIDEISIRKGHTYRIVVSDLIRGRPIWFGGKDRSEASMKEFYDWLGPKKAKGIRLAVMDMWKPFRNATQEHAPQAAILFDKFHIMKHLNDALDKVRKTELLVGIAVLGVLQDGDDGGRVLARRTVDALDAGGVATAGVGTVLALQIPVRPIRQVRPRRVDGSGVACCDAT